MNINDYIEKIGKKHNYSQELIDALKRCIPGMIYQKSEEDIDLLLETLDRVKIYIFDNQPSNSQLTDLLHEQRNGRNSHVTFEKADEEDEITNIPGQYITEPVFDLDMNIIDRIGYICITQLPKDSETARFYNTTINLSHLIHELGHAWGAQKDEYKQEKSGDYIQRCGTSIYDNKVDREKCSVKTTKTLGLYLEEALNTIDEEDTLCRILGINSYEDIPQYEQSKYQVTISVPMRDWVEKLGKSAFDSLRIRNDYAEINRISSFFELTDFIKKMEANEWQLKKRDKAKKLVESKRIKRRIQKKYRSFF